MNKLSQFWKRDKRQDGVPFVHLTDDAPEWLKDAVRDAHGNTFPDDWIYEECEAACNAIDDGSLTSDDDLHGYVDGRVDVYTKQVFQWAADMCLTDIFSEAGERASEYGAEPDPCKYLMTVQFCAIEQIAATILSAFGEAERPYEPEAAEAEA